MGVCEFRMGNLNKTYDSITDVSKEASRDDVRLSHGPRGQR